jgi:hypothetical protein
MPWVKVRRRDARLGGPIAACLLVIALALPAGGVGPRDKIHTGTPLDHLSQSVAIRLRLEQADAPSVKALSGWQATAPSAEGDAGSIGDVFNRDRTGLPQNEESVSVCRSNPRIVLGGTNDYRGLLFPEQGEPFTGWHFSNDGGDSVANEGLLPPVEMQGQDVPPGGDPVVVVHDRTCALYAASLNYAVGTDFPEDLFPNGIGVYKTDPATLAGCGGAVDASCWPTRRAVAEAPDAGHFYDKEWFDVGWSGDAGLVVWVAWADFVADPEAPSGISSVSIKAVRCDAVLEECTDPILISGPDEDVQFVDVTIAGDGSTYMSWSEIRGEIELAPQTFVHKLRVAPPGSTDFGPTRVVYEETLAIPFGGKLVANDFRVATYPKNEVKSTSGGTRVYIVWDACAERVFDETVCDRSRIKLRYSDDQGASWSPVKLLSVGGQNYFPAIANAPGTSKLAVVWFTNRFDEAFGNRQDVELATIDASGNVTDRQRLTSRSNASEADPALGGAFIGDYIEVHVERGQAYVAYNANYRRASLLGEGAPVPQQDNYLVRARL